MKMAVQRNSLDQMKDKIMERLQPLIFYSSAIC